MSVLTPHLIDSEVDSVNLMRLFAGDTVQFETTSGSTWWVTVTNGKRALNNRRMTGLSVTTTNTRGEHRGLSDPDKLIADIVINKGDNWEFMAGRHSSPVSRITVRKPRR